MVFSLKQKVKRIWRGIRESRAIITLGDISLKTWQEKFKEKGIYDCGLSKYIQKFSKNKDTDGASYWLRYNFGTGYRSNDFSMYLDTEFGFILTMLEKDIADTARLKERGLAAIGFNIEYGTIFIKQIQGKYGQAEVLKRFRWEKMLVAIVVDWAKKNRFRLVKIQKAEDNEYYNKNSNDDRRARLRMHYNVTAERSGFKLDKNNSVYILELAA